MKMNGQPVGTVNRCVEASVKGNYERAFFSSVRH